MRGFLLALACVLMVGVVDASACDSQCAAQLNVQPFYSQQVVQPVVLPQVQYFVQPQVQYAYSAPVVQRQVVVQRQKQVVQQQVVRQRTRVINRPFIARSRTDVVVQAQSY